MLTADRRHHCTLGLASPSSMFFCNAPRVNPDQSGRDISQPWNVMLEGTFPERAPWSLAESWWLKGCEFKIKEREAPIPRE